jgi:NOL1/NOP2/fmu family ribosome biogenesis protein
MGTISKEEPLCQTELSYPQAMAYLRHEALVLPADTPRGIVEVCFLGHPLGLVKNIGNRANNLYPKEWKIKTTHIPNEYEPILKEL